MIASRRKSILNYLSNGWTSCYSTSIKFCSSITQYYFAVQQLLLPAMKLLKPKSPDDDELITTTSYKFIARGLYFSRFLRFHPLQWDKLNKTLGASHSKATKIAWAISIAVTISHYFFLVMRTIQTIANENSVTRSIYMTFVTAFFTFPLIFCFHMPMACRQLEQFVNQYLSIFRLYQG